MSTEDPETGTPAAKSILSAIPWLKEMEPKLEPLKLALENTYRRTRAWLQPKLRRSKSTLRQFLVADVRASEAVSRKHVQPEPWLELSILLAALLLSVIIYGIFVSRYYGNLADAIKNSNVILTVLKDAELRPLSPSRIPSGERAGFKDNLALDRRDIFDYLRATGVVDTNVRFDQVSDPNKVPPATNAALAAIHSMIGYIQTCAGRQGELDKVKTVALLICVAMERKYSTVPGCDVKKESNRCRPERWFERGAVDSLAQIPTKGNALASAVADTARVCEPSSPDAPQCQRLRDAVETPPSFWTYAFTYSGSSPAINDLSRAILIGTGVIPRVSAAEGLSTSRPPDLDIGLEKLLRVSFARVLVDPDVKIAATWLAGIRGWEQLAMLFVLFAILFLLLARAIARRTLAVEITHTTKWFQDRVEAIYRKYAVASKEEDTAAGSLEEVPQVKTVGAQNRRRQLLTSTIGGQRAIVRESAQDAFRELDAEIDRMIDSKRKRVKIDGVKIRSDSLALFMASKAVKRMLVADPEPELFRSYCADQRELVEDSAWFLRYLARALPALGFIGTVHGIMLALGDADVIVRAGNPDQLAAAMSSLTTPLSLAFATTFIALVFGLITSYAADRELSKERMLFATLESRLIECVDPAERHAPQPNSPGT